MDFDDTPAEAALRADARVWLEAHAVPRGSPEDFSAGFFTPGLEPAEYVKRCRWWQGQLWEAGWAGVTIPREFGGRGGRPIEATIFAQEQARYGVSVGVFAVAHGMVAPTLLTHGTDEQRRRYLPAMLDGSELWCQLFSEPGAGSDLASLTTGAERDGDEFVVNGQKVWTSNAQFSEWGILLARTHPAGESRHAGISYLVLDMATPGIDIRPLRQLNGEAHFNEVFLTDVRVPVENAVGEIDGGWKVAVTTLSNERVAIAGGSGMSDPARLLLLARDSGVTADPGFRQRLADVHTRNEVIRYLRYRTQTALSHGRRPGPEASVMKLLYADYVKRLADLALSVEGAFGMLEHPSAPAEGVWQQKFFNAVQASIGGGTDQIQRNILGERVLGLPREPR